jgi:hypothetical protein
MKKLYNIIFINILLLWLIIVFFNIKLSKINHNYQVNHIEYMDNNNLSCNKNKLIQTSWDLIFTVKEYSDIDIWWGF